MSDYDSSTDAEIIEELEEIRRRLVMTGKLHAGEDAVMIQAIKRFNIGMCRSCKIKAMTLLNAKEGAIKNDR